MTKVMDDQELWDRARFRDMLLIGRQNRPSLYALHVSRPAPATPPENSFTVRGRIDPCGHVVEPLDEAEIDRLAEEVTRRGLRHVAVCLLFSFVNPAHEQWIGERCRRAGLTVSLSSEVRFNEGSVWLRWPVVWAATVRPLSRAKRTAAWTCSTCVATQMHAGSWSTRSQEFETFTHTEEMKQIVADQKITLIGYRPLRDLQHKERQEAKAK